MKEQIHSGMNREKYLHVAKSYTRELLLPALGSAGPVELVPAEHGHRSYVYFIQGPAVEPMVLRLERDPSSLKRRLRGHEILIRHGFNVPRVLCFHAGKEVFEKYGFFFFVESFMPGEHFMPGPDSGRFGRALGKALARMHAISSPHFGWPGEWRFPGRLMGGARLIATAMKQLETLRRTDPGKARRIRNWLRRQPVSAWFPRPRLTTGGFISSNLLFSQGDVTFIDLARVRYGFAPRDIAQVRLVLTAGDGQARKHFMKAYKEMAPSELRSEIDRVLPLYEVLFILRLAVKGRDTNLDAVLV